MFAIRTFSIPAATLRDLLNFAAASGKPEAATEFADLAIREWLARAKEPAVQTCRQRGYQWKNLFLPEGTQLRVWSRENGSRYAEVVGDEILHARRPITSNQFVRLQEGIPRNAWTEIWLLMPGETAWKAAIAAATSSGGRSAPETLDRSCPLPPPPLPPPHLHLHLQPYPHPHLLPRQRQRRRPACRESRPFRPFRARPASRPDKASRSGGLRVPSGGRARGGWKTPFWIEFPFFQSHP